MSECWNVFVSEHLNTLICLCVGKAVDEVGGVLYLRNDICKLGNLKFSNLKTISAESIIFMWLQHIQSEALEHHSSLSPRNTHRGMIHVVF